MWRGALVVVLLSTAVFALLERQPVQLLNEADDVHLQLLGETEDQSTFNHESSMSEEPLKDTLTDDDVLHGPAHLAHDVQHGPAHKHVQETYQELPGIYFAEASDDLNVADQAACQHQCHDRGEDCKSYSFNSKDHQCKVSSDSMVFNPDAELHIKTKESGYFSVPGLAYYEDEEWIHIHAYAPQACADYCDKATNCKAWKFMEKNSNHCSLTGKSIGFGEGWTYYGKEVQEGAKEGETEVHPLASNHTTQAPEDPTAKALVEQVELEEQLRTENEQLVEAQHEVTAAKTEAREHLINEAHNDQALEIMQARLEDAKNAAEDEVHEKQKEENMGADLEEQKAKALAEEEHMKDTELERAAKVAKIAADGKQKAHEELASVNAHKKQMQVQSAIEVQRQQMQQELAEAERNTTQFVHDLSAEDKLKAELQQETKARIVKIDQGLALQSEEDAEEAETNKRLAQQVIRLQKQRAKKDEERMIAQVNRSLTVEKTFEMAQAELARNNVREEQRINASLIEQNITNLDQAITGETEEAAKLEEKRAETKVMFDEITSRTHELQMAALNAAMPKVDVKLEQEQAKIKKAQDEAAAVQRAAQKKSDAILAAAKEKMDKDLHKQAVETAKKEEQARLAELTRLHLFAKKREADSMTQSKARAAEVADHKAAVQNYTLTLEQGRARVAEVALEASNIIDDSKAYQTLEVAKRQFRQDVEAAYNAIPVLEPLEMPLYVSAKETAALVVDRTLINDLAHGPAHLANATETSTSAPALLAVANTADIYSSNYAGTVCVGTATETTKATMDSCYNTGKGYYAKVTLSGSTYTFTAYGDATCAISASTLSAAIDTCVVTGAATSGYFQSSYTSGAILTTDCTSGTCVAASPEAPASPTNPPTDASSSSSCPSDPICSGCWGHRKFPTECLSVENGRPNVNQNGCERNSGVWCPADTPAPTPDAPGNEENETQVAPGNEEAPATELKAWALKATSSRTSAENNQNICGGDSWLFSEGGLSQSACWAKCQELGAQYAMPYSSGHCKCSSSCDFARNAHNEGWTAEVFSWETTIGKQKENFREALKESVGTPVVSFQDPSTKPVVTSQITFKLNHAKGLAFPADAMKTRDQTQN